MSVTPSPQRSVDLNADVGEAHDGVGRQVEIELIGVVTSVHVACGGHAGDDESMRVIMEAAGQHGVAVGAHPSYPDRPGFGRRPMELTATELSVSLRTQLSDCLRMAQACGVRIQSVKAHGALYGEVGRNGPQCEVLVSAVADLCDPGTAIVLQAGATAREVVEAAGLPVLEEGFCDRAYSADGHLMSRDMPGAVYEDPALAAAQSLSLVDHVDTLCLHGDSPGAVAMAVAVRRALTEAGVAVAAVLQP